ncbi:molybdenum cofactor guanylyltransferase MobA [Thermococcus chitonophagus]|uniref:Probable molybdenum cofactor guanylyltransferase n=1 Tax=Thermococcus chitonophagus TaxID=54262 RepID=A0A160VRK2_9EURY|nr:molybdenum cofactor guanylyltransferase MobA [Thermococcus chitonophagus]ASJ17034.1 molybdenum cofactor guanylyltransferase MobA [Thermococcus chitonophagus]CUX77623.1 Molybdopterin-guanine dinucleotide biosynthesis protein MobA [Thermococcus chitonophagus]
MIGAVLAGGRAKRFGEDKLLFKINGKPLVLHAIERLESSRLIDEIVIVASKFNAEKLRTLGYSVVIDELIVGPISGIFTALSLGDAFVVGGDMPSLIPEFIDYIIKQFNNSGKIVCVPRWSNGYLEPLHSAYAQEFRDILGKRINDGKYKLYDAITSSDACYIDIEALPQEWQVSFFNVNKKEDLKDLTK